MFAGRNLKVFIDGALIAAVKTKSISLNREAIDETDGESNGWQFFNEIPDGRDMAVSVEGVATFDNFSLLEEFEDTGEELPSLVLEFPDGTVLTSTGGAFLQSLSYEGESPGAVQFSAVFLLSGPASAIAIPILTSIDPNQVEEDSGDFVMTLTGLNFEATSVAELDGMEISTVYVSPTELTATVPGSAITDPGTIAVTVSTPGVGTSNSRTLTVSEDSWSPLELGPLIWLDAADAATITLDNGVELWADKSGNSRNFGNVVDAEKPELIPAGLNGLDIVRFNGSSDGLSHGPFNPGASAYSAYILVKVDADPAASAPASGLWFFTSNILGATRTTHHPYIDGVIYESFATPDRKTVGNPSASLAVPHIYNVDSAAGAYTVRLNTAQIFTTGTNTVGVPTNVVYLGRNNSSTYLDGDIAEFLMFAKILSQSEREQLEGYLAWKWGQESLLPPGHPYEDEPP